jgi:hypothetical protein
MVLENIYFLSWSLSILFVVLFIIIVFILFMLLN